jgi:hypothetical protein
MNKEQLDKIEEDYPVGALVLHSRWPARYGIIIESWTVWRRRAGRCLVHTEKGHRAIWSTICVKVISKA